MKRTGLFTTTENIDYSSSTVKTFGGRRLFLLILSILATVSDLVALIIFAVADHGGYITIPALLIVFDALFILGVCFSNFRFKYSVGIWTAYIVVTVILLSMISLSTSSEYPVMTNTAIALNTLAHIALFGAIIFAGIYPLLKQNKKTKIAMITVTAVALILVCSFTLFFTVNGYYGQGFVSEYRNVKYQYDSKSDTYIAFSAEYGRSKKVLIPEQFNGKRVSGINCSMFTDKTINDVCIQSKEKIDFVDDINLTNINSNMRIGIDRDLIDDYRNELLSNYLYSAANSMYPCNLNKDETYITFSYHSDTYEEDIPIVPTWIGRKGDKFSLAYANVDYFEHTDQNDVANLLWCWDNNGGRVLKDFEDTNGNIINGRAINGNIEKVDVDFNMVFQLKVCEDNDSKYEPSDDFKNTTVDGRTYGYRYATVNTVESMTSQLVREGFDLKWGYQSRYNVSSTVASLKDALQEQEQQTFRYKEKISAEITPQWELKAPSEIVISADKNSYIYGDNIQLTGSAKAPNEDCVLKYTWGNLSGQYDVVANECSLINVLPKQSGNYSLTVEASSDKTSLTSKKTVYKNIVIDKKNLDFTWTQPDDMVYDGTAKSVTYACGENQLINGDTLDMGLQSEALSATDAMIYVASLWLSGELDEKYKIATGATFDYQILPRPTNVVWSVGDYVYSGYYQGPSAMAYNIYGSPLLLNLFDSSKRNAGRYTATVTLNDTNYSLLNPTAVYEIKQKSITIEWESSNFVYTGAVQYPRVNKTVGTVSYDSITSEFIYSGYEGNINAKEGYTVYVALPQSSNYKFDSEQYTVYNISKRSITANWSSPRKFTYDGNAHRVRIANFSNIVASDSAKVLNDIKYSGEQVNAGENYLTSAELSEEASVNYIATNMTCEYSIEKRTITAFWSATSFTYDGNSHMPRVVTLADIVEADRASVMSGLEYSGEQTDAGENYTALVALGSGARQNYTLYNSTSKFSIAKAQVAAVWSEVSVDGGNVNPPELVIENTAYAGDVRVVRYTYRNAQGQVISSIPSQNGTYSVTVEIESKNYDLTGLQKTVTISSFDDSQTYGEVA